MIGEKMLAEFLDHQAFTVVACWDLNTEISQHVKTLHPQAPIVSSGNEVIENPDADLIYIATPPVTHVDYGLKVFEQGKTLFMEKPLSINLSDSEKLVNEAKKKAITTVMNFGYAAGPIVETLAKVISGKEFGSVLSIEMRYQFPSWPLPNQLSAASWITNRNTGGMVREMFSHHVYLIHRLIGKLSVQSAEIAYPEGENSAETYALASLETNGVPVRFMGGIGSPATPRDSDFTINFEKSSLRISEGMELLQAKTDHWVPFPVEGTRTAVQARLDQIADLLEGKPVNLPSIEDGFEVQQVIEDLIVAGS
jgi:predicted dehydrogenase